MFGFKNKGGKLVQSFLPCCLCMQIIYLTGIICAGDTDALV
jgi:hypothetical protein